MMEKKADYRIRELIDYWFIKFEEKRNHKPLWGPKDAGLLHGLVRKFDAREMDFTMIQGCMDGYFADSGWAERNAYAFSIFAMNPDKYLKLATPEESKALAIIEKAKEIFGLKPKEEEVLKTFALEDLVSNLSTIYPPTEEGCVQWAKAQRFREKMLEMKEGSLLRNAWIRSGQAARVYFGDALVDQAWKDTKGHEDRVKSQAKEILTEEKK